MQLFTDSDTIEKDAESLKPHMETFSNVDGAEGA